MENIKIYNELGESFSVNSKELKALQEANLITSTVSESTRETKLAFKEKDFDKIYDYLVKGISI